MNVHSLNKRSKDRKSPARPKPSRRGSEPTAGKLRGRPVVDDKQRRLLDAGLKTFAERGYHGTTVPEVAKAAGIAVGTVYLYFDNKDELVNEVYRDAKLRLRRTLLEGLPDPVEQGESWFGALWQRLAVFARAEPDAFRFLEMQDHVHYLDAESRQVELTVLTPLLHTGKKLRASKHPSVEVVIALLWGAFVGLVKAGRLGYVKLDDATFEAAGRAAWHMVDSNPKG